MRTILCPAFHKCRAASKATGHIAVEKWHRGNDDVEMGIVSNGLKALEANTAQLRLDSLAEQVKFDSQVKFYGSCIEKGGGDCIIAIGI